MQDEVLVRLPKKDVPASAYGKLTVKELGAAKSGIHVRCDVCGHITGVDDKTARSAFLKASHSKLSARADNRLQEFFTNAWGWKTYWRRPGSRDRIRSKAVTRVFVTGAGRFIRFIYRKAKRLCDGPWFCVAMHGQPGMGEQMFVCRLDGLVEAIRGICKEAPDLRRQLLNALESSNPVDTVNLQAAREAKDDSVLLFDHASAISIE